MCASDPVGIISDWDLCLRMWTVGWQVLAAKQVHMTHDKEEGGTHRPETAERCRVKQQEIARDVVGVSFYVLFLIHGNVQCDRLR